MACSLQEEKSASCFQANLYPKRITSVDNKEMWIGDWLGDLELVTYNGKVVRSLSLDFHINDIAETKKNGSLLITDEDNCKIACLSKDGVFSDFYSTGPFEPCGICVTESGDVIVTLALHNPDTDMYTGKIAYLSSSGDLKKSIQNDYDGMDVFAKPHFITCNINGDVWIQDWWYQHVIVIDNKGGVRLRYDGQNHSDVALPSDFYPLGLDHNSIGQVIIADYYNAALHLVNQDGQLISYIMTQKDGLCRPFPISFDKDDTLLVGDEENKSVYVVKYKREDS